MRELLKDGRHVWRGRCTAFADAEVSTEMFGQRAADGKPSANFGRLGGNSIRRCSRDDRRGEVCERTKYFHQFDPCVFFTQSRVSKRESPKQRPELPHFVLICCAAQTIVSWL